MKKLIATFAIAAALLSAGAAFAPSASATSHADLAVLGYQFSRLCPWCH